MRVEKEDWSANSMPLQKSREPKGEVISSEMCPLCNKRVRTIGGKMSKHDCKPVK